MDAPERVLKVINHEEPDKVPAFETTITNNALREFYGMPINDRLHDLMKTVAKMGKKGEKLLKKSYTNKNLVKQVMRDLYEFYYRAKLDIALSMASLFTRKVIGGGNKYIDEYGRLFQYETYEDKNGIRTTIGGYLGGIFKTFEDYEEWEQPDPYWEGRMINFEAGREVQKEMKNKIFSIPSTAAMMEVTWQSFGLENFSRILAKNKNAKKVFDDRGKFTLEVVKQMAENDAKIILLWDDYGYKNGLFMSPQNYKKYVFPWLKRICKAAHKHNCKIFLHSDGDLMEIFEDLIGCGVDILNPIEPTTANIEYDIFKLNQKYGDKLTFSGNVSPTLLATGRISEIESYAKRLILELAPGGGYIFSSGHSINPAIPPENYEAMQDIKERYGIYPIKNLNSK
jgi:uroporphyrinogen decarboxylase